MKIGIIGLPQVGKKTVFYLMTKVHLEQTALSRGKVPTGVAKIEDSRLEKLSNLYKPKKTTPSTFEVVLVPSLDSSDLQVFSTLEQMDLLCHVVRAFENDQVFHIKGSVDPKRDIELVQDELNLQDLMFVEKRLERIEKDRGRRKIQAGEEELLRELKDHLDGGKALTSYPFREEQTELIKAHPFLTLKKQVVVVNAGEENLGDPSFLEGLQKDFDGPGREWVVLSARLEEELEELESEEERREYLSEFNIQERALEKLTRACFSGLQMITFFTVGPDECRAWNVPRGSTAPRAARVIHTDLERGFIRAEVMKYRDLIEYGAEKKLKEVGKFYTKGKDYLVEEEDILHILFNV